jgi:3-oxoacyl-[acyl-carrier protein] reductase
MKCRDKVAMVTGAAGKGMGRSIALSLAREGAKVIVNYRSSEGLANEIVEHIVSTGGVARAIQADVQNRDDCVELVEATIEAFGRIDICIVGPGGGWHMESIDRIDTENALRDVSQELAPLYNLMPLVLPKMYEQNWGRLIALSLEPSYGSPAYAYNVAKSARSQAVMLASSQAWPHGVTMNVVGPGPVRGIATLDEAIDQVRHGDFWSNRNAASPQDVAEAVSFLCSDAGRFITGCIVPFK